MKIRKRSLVLFGGLLIVLLAMAADTVVVVKIQPSARIRSSSPRPW